MLSGEKILRQFDKVLEQYHCLESEVSDRVTCLIKKENIHIHTMNSRIKDRESLRKKISRPDRTYHKLSDISDLLGIRIITYFESDIDKLAELVERSFQVDLVRSIDKRKIHDTGHFGYLSLHYICSLLPGESTQGLVGIPFEIQIRTILQHAWAEIEHDLGYKYQDGTPHHIRRKFSRLAGILEMADEEFCSIRNYLKNYQQNMVREIAEKSQEIETDEVSLNAYIRTDRIRQTDEEIAKEIGIIPDDNLFFPDYLIRLLHFLEINSIKELDKLFSEYQHQIKRFVTPYFLFTKRVWNFGIDNLDRFPRGYSIFFLGHLIAYRKCKLNLEKIEYMCNFYTFMDHIENPQEVRAVASGFVEIMSGFECDE